MRGAMSRELRFLRRAVLVVTALMMAACGGEAEKPAAPVTQLAPGREAPPVEGKSVLYRLASDGSDLQRVEIPAIAADAPLLDQVQALVKGLADPRAFPETVDPKAFPETIAPLPELSAVIAVYTVRDTLVVDMNGTFGQGIGAGSNETLDAVRAMTRTLSANFPEINGLRILLDGQDPGNLNGVELAVRLRPRRPWSFSDAPMWERRPLRPCPMGICS